jgi:hypothetical protein
MAKDWGGVGGESWGRVGEEEGKRKKKERKGRTATTKTVRGKDKVRLG